MATETAARHQMTQPGSMRVGLFIPCYVDLLFPEVGIATLELLERLGLEVGYPLGQTCCGQPMSNSGDEGNAAGSCVKQVRQHFDTIEQTDAVQHVRQHTYELVEFLHDIVQVQDFPWAEFPHAVGLHNSCSSIRGLGLAKPSEIMGTSFNKTADLLTQVKGLILVPLDRPDDCCGFGGTFCVTDPAVSARMGMEKVRDHLRHGAEYNASTEM